jgi:hypothetical protein
MKTNNFYRKTIIDNINFDGYGDYLDILGVSMEEGFDHELYVNIHNLYHIFKVEYGWRVSQIGEYNAFGEWLQGLPSVLTVPFYNYDILENAKNAGFFRILLISNGEEEEIMAEGRTLLRKQEKFLDTYWEKLSLAFFNIKDELCVQR